MAQAFLVELIRLVFLGSVGVSTYIWLYWIDQIPIEFGKIGVAYSVSYCAISRI